MAPINPADWEEKYSSSKQRVYYFNRRTGESQWEPPTEISNQQSKERVHASHILLKHTGSRKPFSWRTDSSQSPIRITRTLEEARQQAREIKSHLLSSEQGVSKELAELATNLSDCSSAKRGGDLGYFERGVMQKPFEDAAFSLQPGELSEPVETESGVHLIYRRA